MSALARGASKNALRSKSNPYKGEQDRRTRQLVFLNPIQAQFGPVPDLDLEEGFLK